MNKSDRWVIVVVILLISLHLSVLIAGYLMQELAYFIAFLNLASGLSIILYWIQKEIQITQHSIERREMFVLGFEICMMGFAIFEIVYKKEHNVLIGIQYVFFGIHLLSLILFLVFMLTFKIKRLM